MTPSKILFFLCLSFILGIFFESLAGIPQILVWGILISGILLVFTSIIFLCLFSNSQEHWNKVLIGGFLLLFFVLGVLRVQISEFNIVNDKLSKFNDKGKIILNGVISSEPDVRDTSQKLKVQVGESVVLVTTKRYPEYKYLDKVKLTGKLETPMVFDDFNYKNYLLKDHIYSVMAFPKIEVLGKASGGPFSAVYSWVLFCKGKIRESINQNFLPPQSSILAGTILGDNGVMTNDLKSKLNITGLRHIIAVSGTHVVILCELIMLLLLGVGIGRGKAFYFAVIFIFIYIVLTGLPSSGVRAGIMGVIFLLSQKVGRQAMGSRLIVLAGAIMLLINPLLLIYDVGFQLSFLAVLGLIYLEPLIKILIKKLTKEKARNLVSIVSMTFAAQIFTLPIMIYNFGNISFVSLITNLLIGPVVYWLMIFGFLASIVGIFSNVLVWIFSIPCWFLLEYFIKIIDFFSQPWAMKTIQNIHWIWLVILYSAIIFATWLLNKKYKQEFM
jgi:competence protein ComEC